MQTPYAILLPTADGRPNIFLLLSIGLADLEIYGDIGLNTEEQT